MADDIALTDATRMPSGGWRLVTGRQLALRSQSAACLATWKSGTFGPTSDALYLQAESGGEAARMTVQEMVLAVWMIARGFRPAAVSTMSELADGTLRDTPLASR